MAVTPAPDELSDAEVTDGIGAGDVACAARLWVRFWPTALSASRLYVEPEEVPGLAAEALIGTITAIAIGRGPREDVGPFVAAAVHELGLDDDDSLPASTGGATPDIFVSATMTDAFAALDEETQRALQAVAHEGRVDYETVGPLTVLQHYYLAEHADRAETRACRRAHIAMMAAVDGSATEGLSRETWLHLSTCAWCTEAFHEVAFSSVALGSLIAPAVLDGVPAVPVPVMVEEPVVVEEVEDSTAPELVPEAPIPPEPDEDLPVAAPRRRRRRVLAAVTAAAAAAVVLSVIMAGLGNDGTTPAAKGTDPTESAAGDPTASSGSTSSTDEPSIPTTPSGVTTVAAPLVTPTDAATTAAAEKPTTTPKPSAKPTPKPSAKPSPSTAPSPTSAPSTSPPTSSPTATPTETCNGLQHLLGLC